MPPPVHFPIYRRYTELRKSANNAMMSLLAGSALASHTLQLTEGSNRLLPEIFPAVEHIARFNLRPDAAAKVLRAAGPHLATVTVPYALAIHEDFVKQCINWLRLSFHFPLPTAVRGIRTWNDVRSENMHEALESMTSRTLALSSSVDLELFHLYRLVRNSHIHGGGKVTNPMRTHVRAMSLDAQARWETLTGRTAAELIQGGEANYALSDVLAVFAVTKELGYGVNTLLLSSLSQAQWASICVEDFRGVTKRPKNGASWGRGLIGYAHGLYRAVGLSKPLLFRAAFNEGVWPDPTKYP